MGTRFIGIDIHRSFAQVAILDDGRIREELRVDLIRNRFMEFARSLKADDEVVIEATGNSAAVERLLRPFVKRVAVANPRLVKAIAYARVKTDKIDAKILATLHAAGFLPEVWVPDEVTLVRRRQIAERMGVLAQLVRTKGRIQALLHANLIPQYKGHLFGPAGRRWLHSLPLDQDERSMLTRYADELERVSAQLANLDKVLAQQTLDDPRAKRLMTIPGVSRGGLYGFSLDRRRASVPDPCEAKQLLRLDASDPAVGRPSGSPRTDHQAGQQRCQADARGSGLVRENGAWTPACLLCAHAEEAGRPDGGCGDRT